MAASSFSAVDYQRGLFEQFLQSQFWPAARLVEYQRTQIEALLRHARAKAPFYARRLDPVFRPDGSVDWSKWGDIPIVRRRDMVDNPGALLASDIPATHAPTGQITTSGTTGEPLTLVFTQMVALASVATRWRSDLWNGLDWSKTLYMRHGEDAAAVPPDGVAMGPWGPPWLARSRAGASFRLNREVEPRDQLAFMARTGARYAAVGITKHAHVIAAEARRLGIEMKLEAVLVNGEAADQSDREICQEVFGARIVDVYSSKEGNHMAHRCEHGSWHINAETVLLEILDADGLPCRPGETGRVVITPFWNFAQPLIRYEQGDLAVAGEPCPCGRNLPTMGMISGRLNHMFRHPDGRMIARALPEQFRVALQAGRWQFAQVAANAYEIRYVPKDWDKIGDEPAVAEAFRNWYFEDATVSFRRVTEIPALPSGKFMEYVNELPPQTESENGQEPGGH